MINIMAALGGVVLTHTLEGVALVRAILKFITDDPAEANVALLQAVRGFLPADAQQRLDAYLVKLRTPAT